MRVKKTVISGVLCLGIYAATVSGINNGLVYADTTEAIYKAFDYDVSFDDPFFIYQWGMKNYGDFEYTDIYIVKSDNQPDINVKAVYGIDINLPGARGLYSGGKRETIVAIIDSGVDYKHEDLKNVLWVNPGEIPGNGIDDDNNGYVDDVNGWNFYDHNNILYNGEEDAQGTHVAGTIVANNNSKGIAGIAGSSTVKIMVLKSLGGEKGEDLEGNVVEAIKYAEKMGAKICNLSIGTDDPNIPLEEAIRDSDMLFVVAAGNGDEGIGIGNNLDNKPMYPASYKYNNLITVGNLQADGNLHPSSNYSKNYVDLAAPGSRIVSTIDSANFKVGYASGKLSAPYAYMTGSSMAVPYVVGTAALLYSEFPRITLNQVKEAILGGVKVLPGLKGKVSTGGMLNADGAFNYVIDNFYESVVDDNYTVGDKNSKGKAPLIFISFTKDGRVLVKISDKDKDLSLVRYAKGKKGVSYFSKNKKGTKIILNKKNEKVLKLKKGVYTFYAIDKKGNRTTKTVHIK